MHCFKVRAWFGLDYECPNEDIFTQAICNSYWSVIIGGTGVQTCASCYLYLCMNSLTERRSDEQEKETKKAQKKGS